MKIISSSANPANIDPAVKHRDETITGRIFEPRVPICHPARRDILFNRFPLKHGWDGLALVKAMAQPNLTFKQRLATARFYFDVSGIDNLFASLTRSGSHWSIAGISIALNLMEGLSGDYHYDDARWIPEGGLRYAKLDWRVPAESFSETVASPVNNPFMYHSHHPYYRIRTAKLKRMKIVIVLRDIFGSMTSKFYKLASSPDLPMEADVEAFEWEKLAMDAIEFFNSWGDVIRWHPNCVVFRYEDALKRPVEVHQQMLAHWGINVPDEFLE